MRHFYVAACFLILVIVSGCGNEQGAGNRAGQQAPDFQLNSLAGKPVQLSSAVEKSPVLLVFWATWCPPCVQEIPVLKEWHERYGERLQILAVAVQEKPEKLRTFVQEYGISYPVLPDTEGTVASRYNISGLPVAILLAKERQILYYGFTLPDIGDFVK